MLIVLFLFVYLTFQACSEILRLQWVHTLGLAAKVEFNDSLTDSLLYVASCVHFSTLPKTFWA